MFWNQSPEGFNALQLARDGNENTPLLIWFSDNITNIDLNNDVKDFSEGAILLTLKNPSDFGIAIIKDGNVVVDVMRSLQTIMEI